MTILQTWKEVLNRIEQVPPTLSGRKIIGIVGKPGSGKSTFSAKLQEHLKSIQIVPMDGYHLSNQVLKDRNLAHIKGAPETFDSIGFATLLERISTEKNDPIYFPVFHREIEESIAAEGVILKETSVVVTEGNYLLFAEHGWQRVRKALSEVWFLDVDDEVRMSRLIQRHIRFGKEPVAAKSWAEGSDEANARLIASTRGSADVYLDGNQLLG